MNGLYFLAGIGCCALFFGLVARNRSQQAQMREALAPRPVTEEPRVVNRLARYFAEQDANKPFSNN